MLYIFITFALFASVFTIEKKALEYSQPLFLVGSRMFVAGFLMLCYQYIVNPKELKIQKKHVLGFVGLAIFSVYVTNCFELLSMNYMSSYKICFIYALSPFISAVFSYLFFSELLSLKKWIGLAIGLLGFIPFLSEQLAVESIGSAAFLSFPCFMMLIAVICSVYGWVQLKKLVHDHGYTPCMANGFAMLVGGFIALINSLLVEHWTPLPVIELYPFLEYSTALLIISNIICYNMYIFLLKNFSATFLAFAGNTTPMFSALLGWLFLGETITWQFCCSIIIVSFGVFIFFKDEVRIGGLKLQIET